MKESVDIIRRIAAQNGGENVVIATEPTECTGSCIQATGLIGCLTGLMNAVDGAAEMWRMRKEALWSIMSMYPEREALITDVCVPLTELAGKRRTSLD